MFAGDVSVYLADKMDKIYWVPSTVRTPPPPPILTTHTTHVFKSPEFFWKFIGFFKFERMGLYCFGKNRQEAS